MRPTSVAVQDSICLYRDEIYALSKMSFQLIVSQMLDEVHEEYKIILKANNIKHQFISGIISERFVLGCIDPIYRHGKPLIYTLDSRHMILAMCDGSTNSNSSYSTFPTMHVITANDGISTSFKISQMELIPLGAVQNRGAHFTYRPFIEFNHVDTFGPLAVCQRTLLFQQNRQVEVSQPPTFVPARYNCDPGCQVVDRTRPTNSNYAKPGGDDFFDSLFK